MIIVRVNSIKGQILNCSSDISFDLYEKLSYQAYNYQFSDQYINGFWDGKIRKFSRKTNSFSSGLLYRVLIYLKKKKIPYILEDTRKKFYWDEETIYENMEDFKFSLRPYQVDGLIMGLNHPYMIYWWATSSGKTVQFSALISSLKINGNFRKTLVLVSNKDLAAQHRIEMEDMLGVKIGRIEEGKFEPKLVTVAVINTLWQGALKKKNKNFIKYLGDIEHLISDEAHHIIDSKMFKQTIAKCTKTVARHGFSGSPFSLTTDDLELESITGPPLSRVSMSDLILGGWVSRPVIYMIKYDSSWLHHASNHAEVYRKKIVEELVRNEIIIDIVNEEYIKNNQIVLILVRIIDHGKILSKMLIDSGIPKDEFVFIHGSTPDYSRMKVKEGMKKGDFRLVIASQIWNEGIDVPSINVLIKADAGGGKEIQDNRGIRSVIQQTGRVIRKPINQEEGDVDISIENLVKIYDFFDETHKDLLRHSINRINTFSMEKEFIIRKVKYEKAKGERSYRKVFEGD